MLYNKKGWSILVKKMVLVLERLCLAVSMVGRDDEAKS